MRQRWIPPVSSPQKSSSHVYPGKPCFRCCNRRVLGLLAKPLRWAGVGSREGWPRKASQETRRNCSGVSDHPRWAVSIGSLYGPLWCMSHTAIFSGLQQGPFFGGSGVCVCVCVKTTELYHFTFYALEVAAGPCPPEACRESLFASPYLLSGAGDPQWPWPPTALLHLCFVSICVLSGCLSSHGHHLIWTPGLLD